MSTKGRKSYTSKAVDRQRELLHGLSQAWLQFHQKYIIPESTLELLECASYLEKAFQRCLDIFSEGYCPNAHHLQYTALIMDDYFEILDFFHGSHAAFSTTASAERKTILSARKSLLDSADTSNIVPTVEKLPQEGIKRKRRLMVTRSSKLSVSPSVVQQ